MSQTYHILTYGCQMNKNDSERISGMLENLGYQPAEDWRASNLVIVNTCSVRDKAERRVLGQFHAMNHFRKQNSAQMKLAITGCMPQHMKEFVSTKLPFLDYVVGVNNMEELPVLLAEDISFSDQIRRLRPNRKIEHVSSFEENLQAQKREAGDKAWVSIMFGCNKFCSYCIVPFTRGREISRRKEDIFKEIALLEEKGYSHVVLLGQNVNSWGKDFGEELFPALLAEIAENFSFIKKLDFLTSHPHDVNPLLAEVIRDHENINKEVHFPLQHGDDEMLELMKREYTYSEYLAKVEHLRRTIPGVRIGTDLITGFPGETDAHFENLMKAVRDIGFSWANTASFSPRPGTAAARLPGQLDEKIKNTRLNMLNRLLDDMYRERKKTGVAAEVSSHG